MLRDLPESELRFWCDYYQRVPFGPTADAYRHAQLMHLVSSALGGKAALIDFLPNGLRPLAAAPVEVDEQLNFLAGLPVAQVTGT